MSCPKCGYCPSCGRGGEVNQMPHGKGLWGDPSMFQQQQGQHGTLDLEKLKQLLQTKALINAK